MSSDGTSLEYFFVPSLGWRPIQAGAANADGVTVSSTTFLLRTTSFGYAFNGTSWDRLRNNDASNMSPSSIQGDALLVENVAQFSINHTPVANTQATITQAAGGSGVRNVCKSIAAALNALAAAAETTVLLNLRDGATGAGTILWSLRLHAIPAGTTGVALSGLAIPGSANTAMTLEFAAAGGANTFESVALTGYQTD